MIRYPNPLRIGQTIGVTAPSSGVEKELHSLLNESKQQFEKRGFKVEYRQYSMDSTESSFRTERRACR